MTASDSWYLFAPTSTSDILSASASLSVEGPPTGPEGRATLWITSDLRSVVTLLTAPLKFALAAFLICLLASRFMMFSGCSTVVLTVTC